MNYIILLLSILVSTEIFAQEAPPETPEGPIHAEVLFDYVYGSKYLNLTNITHTYFKCWITVDGVITNKKSVGPKSAIRFNIERLKDTEYFCNPDMTI